tara:strand:- start:4 stop:333 length:330 start_codon:yes stop_codon:yes gene_type:complete
MKSILNICNKSLNHFKKLLINSNSKYILIGVKGGGCNGLKYYIEPTNEEPNKLDEIIIKDDIQINICNKSIFYLIGTEIKWTDDNLGSGIVFNNPNAKNTCGCGDTFSL